MGRGKSSRRAQVAAGAATAVGMPALRPVSQEELQRVVEAHRQWLLSGGNEGARAELDHCDLSGSQLRLEGAFLSQASFREANLGETYLQQADLRGADLRGADLKRSGLPQANLQGADLRGAALNLDYLKAAHNWVLACYDPRALAALGLPAEHNEKVRARDLSGAALQGADLAGADLDRANMSGADLEGADLSQASLRGADLRGAHLDGAQLVGAQLQGADLTGAGLRGAGLRGAELVDAKLREADLRDADLSETIGLQAGQLAGANVSNAKLPEAVEKFEGLKQVEELSKNTGKLLVAMLSACAYAALTVFGTKDAQLLGATGGAKLPLVDIEIPIVWFYGTMPILLVCLYLYLLLYQQRLWEQLAALPAIFPDGVRLDEKAYPWLPNGLVGIFFTRLAKDPPRLSWLQRWASVVVTWSVVPLTLVLFWWRHLSRAQWTGSGWVSAVAALHGLLLVAAVWVGDLFYRLTAETLSGGITGNSRSGSGVGIRPARAVVLALGGALLLGVPWMARRRVPQLQAADLRGLDLGGADLRGGRLPDANLQKTRLSGAWLDGSDLRGAQLQEADLTGAHLRRARLGRANLTGASCPSAALSAAELDEAQLSGATLSGADLRQARLVWARLERARLERAHLEGADLSGADLRQADLAGAALSGSQLLGTDLRGAGLESADLRGAILDHARLEGARLGGAHLEKAELLYARLGNANLAYADLRAAQLREIDFGGARLRGADLRGADLRRSDLRRVLDLTRAQLREAIVDADTRLPPGLRRPSPAAR